MKICVFGADGKTGVEVVKYSWLQNIDVVAFVYSNASNNYFPKGVEIKRGNIMNYSDVCEAIKGVDAVISVVGHIKNSDPLMQTKGMENIIKAMESVGVKRVLSLTGTGARAQHDTPSIIDIILNFFVKLVDPKRIIDGIKHVEVLQKSSLDWTVLRVLKLSNSNAEVNHYTLTEGGPAEIFTSRKKVAMILVDLIDDKEYIKKLPIVSR